MPRSSIPFAFGAVIAGLTLAASVQAAPVTSFSLAWFDSTEPTANRRTADAQTGTASAAVSNTGVTNENGYRLSTYAGSASSDLSTGSLRLSTSLSVTPGDYVYEGGPGRIQSGLYTLSAFGDSFRTTSADGSPFNWSSSTASFSIALTGQREQSGLQIADVFPYSNPGTSFDAIKTWFYFTAYKPGTLDLVYEYMTFDPSRPFSELVSLNDQIQANTLFRNPCTAITSPGWGDDAACAVAGLPDELSVSFAPGGDFDWHIQIATSIYIDWATHDASALMDLGNTAVVSYSAPAGATTYSGSGVFPGTLDMADLPGANTVPTPASALLVLAGLAALGAARRRCS